MNDVMLKAATTTKVYVGSWVNTRVEAMKSKDRGQGALEYVGITILVVAILVLLLDSNMGQTITDKFKEQVNKVLNKGAA